VPAPGNVRNEVEKGGDEICADGNIRERRMERFPFPAAEPPKSPLAEAEWGTD
jgi:hypothetical protein